MISVRNVSKVYHLYRHSFERILDTFGGSKRRAEFYALNAVNFRIEKREVFALIGPSGSGKSTLLPTISGVRQPATGRVLRGGRLAALLEPGAGFNPEFSGRDNVYLNGESMGLSRKDMQQALPKIEAFADIGRFIDRPVKEYSTGMYVRLALSTAIHIDPEILIVGEALAVGDAIFASRCIRKFGELRPRKVTILLVSHDLGLVKRLADRAAFLPAGKRVMEGSPKDSVNEYAGFALDQERSNKERATGATGGIATTSSFRHGDGASRIVDVRLLNSGEEPSRAFRPANPSSSEFEPNSIKPSRIQWWVF